MPEDGGGNVSGPDIRWPWLLHQQCFAVNTRSACCPFTYGLPLSVASCTTRGLTWMSRFPQGACPTGALIRTTRDREKTVSSSRCGQVTQSSFRLTCTHHPLARTSGCGRQECRRCAHCHEVTRNVVQREVAKWLRLRIGSLGKMRVPCR